MRLNKIKSNINYLNADNIFVYVKHQN